MEKSKEIPKFSSFKASLPQSQSGQNEPKYQTPSEDRRRSQSQSDVSLPRSCPGQPASVNTVSPFYAKDVVGDHLIISYGTLDRSSVPQYRRSGKERILGIKDSWRIDRDYSNGTSTALAQTAFDSESHVQLRSRRLLSGRTDYGLQPDEEVRVNGHPNSQDQVEDFISIAPYDENQLSKDPLAFRTSVDAGSVAIVRSQSCDVQHPDPGSIGHDVQQNRTHGGRQERMQIQESLEYVTNSQHKWSKQEASVQWRKLLKVHPHSYHLWRARIDYKQYLEMEATFDEVIGIYVDCLANFRDFSPEPEEQHDLRQFQLYIISRITLLMRETGYTERAYALWQAFLELQCFASRSVDDIRNDATLSDQARVIDRVQGFWDSEAPRIGEADYRLKPVEPVKSNTSEPTKHCENSQISKSDPTAWAKCERELDTRCHFAARTTDENDPDDLHRVVLFSELRPFLTYVVTPFQVEDIINHILLFCDLMPYTDKLACTESGKCTASDWARPGYGTRSREYRLTPALLFGIGPVRCFVFSEDVQAHANSKQAIWILRVMQSLCATRPQDTPLALYCLALEAKISLSTAVKSAKRMIKTQSTNFELYNALAMIEYSANNTKRGDGILLATISSIRQSGKSQLRAKELIMWHSLVWAAFSRRDYTTALLFLMQIEEPPAHASSLEALLARTDLLESATARLRAFQYFESNIEQKASTENQESSLIAARLFLIFTYLSRGHDLRGAADQIGPWQTKLSSSNLEILLQDFAQIIYSHLSGEHASTADIHLARSLLMQWIQLYPRNTIFTQICYWLDHVDYQRGHEIDARDSMKRALHRARIQSLQASTSAQMLMTIKSTKASSQERKALRSSYEDAIAHSEGRRSEVVWREFIEFEMIDGDLTKLSSLFFRAIRHCPWSKRLYLLGIQFFVEHAQSQQAADLLKSLMERDIRMRVDPDF